MRRTIEERRAARFLADNGTGHAYSPEFQARLSAMLDRDAAKARQSTRRRVLVCALVGLLVSCTAVRPAYEYMANAVLRHTAKYVQIRFYPEEDGEEVPCTLHYVPEGYTLTDSRENGKILSQYYADTDGNLLYFLRQPAGNSMDSYLDNEHSTFSSLTIGETKAIFMKGNDEDSINGLIWSHKGFSYVILAPLNKKELIEIMKSVW